MVAVPDGEKGHKRESVYNRSLKTKREWFIQDTFVDYEVQLKTVSSGEYKISRDGAM